MRLSTGCLTLGAFVWAASAFGFGKFNEKSNIGERAPAFEKLPCVDGKQYSTRDFEKAKVLVVVFTCNSCPYAVDYEDRLVAFHKRFCETDEVALVAINCNLIPADSLDNMKKRAEEKGFRFPYLFDESQRVAEEFGAVRTPECFVLDRERRIVYMGAFDDSAKEKQVARKHVESAVEATLAGKAADTAETAPVGCLIRFKRKRP